MKKILIYIPLLFLTACTRDLTSLNNDPKNPKNVPAYSLLTNAQRSMARTITSANVNLNIFRLIVQYWQEVTYLDESRYDLNTRDIPQNFWTAFYRDALRDFDEAKKLIPQQVKITAQRDNQLAVTDIMEVLVWYYMVTTYGDIPYTDALNIENVFPKYDDAKTIYTDLLTRLNADIAALNTSEPGFGSADVIYGGDIALWKKFANSLKLKMGMTIADFDLPTAKTAVETAYASGLFTSNDDNAQFKFLASPPNTNPVWEDLVQSGRKDFVAASTIINQMETLSDPRIDNYFTLDGNDPAGYSGGSPGRSSNYSTFSKPSDAITKPDYPGMLLDFSEVQFFLAEAKERGFSVGAATAKQHYDSAVTASIVFWGGTETQALTYLARADVSYTTAPGTYRQKIGLQKWIAMYNRGLEEWIEWRRLDAPVLAPAYRAVSDIPFRYTYPVNEQNYNTKNYNDAAAAIGGDDVTTKLWWDIY